MSNTHFIFAANPFYPTYWLETIAILAFGVSWLVKGEAILRDEEENIISQSKRFSW